MKSERKNAFRKTLLCIYIHSNYGNLQVDKPSSFEADEVKWFTVERGEVTLLLMEWPPLKIYTWICMTDDREQFEMPHGSHISVMMILQPNESKMLLEMFDLYNAKCN